MPKKGKNFKAGDIVHTNPEHTWLAQYHYGKVKEVTDRDFVMVKWRLATNIVPYTKDELVHAGTPT